MGDAAKGKQLFKELCSGCHTSKVGEPAKSSSNLFGIMGKTCTCKMKATRGLTWNEPTMDKYLENPQKTAPGSKMPVSIKDPKDRKDIIAFLNTLKE